MLPPAPPTTPEVPHFVVHGKLLSAWRFWGQRPACLSVAWPPASPAHPHQPECVSPLPLLLTHHGGVHGEPHGHWLPMHLHHAWCVGPWQWLFFSTPWQPGRLAVFWCKGRNPMLRLYLRHMQQQARMGAGWGEQAWHGHNRGLPGGAHVY